MSLLYDISKLMTKHVPWQYEPWQYSKFYPDILSNIAASIYTPIIPALWYHEKKYKLYELYPTRLQTFYYFNFILLKGSAYTGRITDGDIDCCPPLVYLNFTKIVRYHLPLSSHSGEQTTLFVETTCEQLCSQESLKWLARIHAPLTSFLEMKITDINFFKFNLY